MASIYQQYLEAKDSLDYGDITYREFLSITDPMSDYGVFRPVIKQLESTVNDPRFYELTKAERKEILDTLAGLQGYRSTDTFTQFFNDIDASQGYGVTSTTAKKSKSFELARQHRTTLGVADGRQQQDPKYGSFEGYLDVSGDMPEWDVTSTVMMQGDQAYQAMRIYGRDGIAKPRIYKGTLQDEGTIEDTYVYRVPMLDRVVTKKVNKTTGEFHFSDVPTDGNNVPELTLDPEARVNADKRKSEILRIYNFYFGKDPDSPSFPDHLIKHGATNKQLHFLFSNMSKDSPLAMVQREGLVTALPERQQRARAEERQVAERPREEAPAPPELRQGRGTLPGESTRQLLEQGTKTAMQGFESFRNFLRRGVG